jgi:hypothetical protein
MVQRAIIQSLIGAFGGASAIHFFNTYALYFHAYYQGFRIPVEGVEYLNLAVSLVSFIIFLISLGSSMVFYFILKKISAFFFDDWTRRNGNSKNMLRLNKRFGILLLTVSTIPYLYWIISFPSMKNIVLTIIPFSMIVIFFLGIHFVRKDSSIKKIVLGITFIGIIASTTFLFYQPFYKQFLKKIRYGGGISVEIEYRKADNTESNVKGLLLIRTSKGIILKDSISGNQFEIPVERVSKITFLKQELNVK